MKMFILTGALLLGLAASAQAQTNSNYNNNYNNNTNRADNSSSGIGVGTGVGVGVVGNGAMSPTVNNYIGTGQGAAIASPGSIIDPRVTGNQQRQGQTQTQQQEQTVNASPSQTVNINTPVQAPPISVNVAALAGLPSTECALGTTQTVGLGVSVIGTGVTGAEGTGSSTPYEECNERMALAYVAAVHGKIQGHDSMEVYVQMLTDLTGVQRAIDRLNAKNAAKAAQLPGSPQVAPAAAQASVTVAQVSVSTAAQASSSSTSTSTQVAADVAVGLRPARCRFESVGSWYYKANCQ